jgi:hypothetical protein
VSAGDAAAAASARPSDPWAARLVEPAEVLAGGASGAGLGPLLGAFVAWQARHWPRLAEAMATVAAARTRVLRLPGREVTVQLNPTRAVNTRAKVDPETIRSRPCFLCPDALPPEQRALGFGERLVLLANPAPILPPHLTVVDRRHRPQRLDDALDDAMDLAMAAAPTATVLYNGPTCGASAPDHLHLQVVPSGVLPEERLMTARLAAGTPGEVAVELGQGHYLVAWSARRAARAVLVLHGRARGMAAAIRTALAALAAVTGAACEPCVNLLLRSAGGGVATALVFPRRAHRPACYFAQGDDALLVSPGSIDMGGQVITVRERDFDCLDAPTMADIYRQVTLDDDVALAFEAEVRRRLCHE